MAAPLDRNPPRRIAPVTIWPAGQGPERGVTADGSKPPHFADDSVPAAPSLAKVAYETALRQLGILARLPTRIVAARSERELREIVGETVVDLLGGIQRFELFVAEGPNGTLVPAGNDSAGLSLLGLVLGSEAPYLERATVIEAVAGVHGDLVTAPLADRQQPVGLLIVEAPADRRFVVADLEALHSVAVQISLALQRLHIERRSAAHLRMERDMVLAREVQRRFLPAALPASSQLRVAAHYRPAYDVGGDFYDLISHENGDISAIVGDVAGKGVAAALLMSRLTSDIRRLGPGAESPRTLLHELHRLIEADAPPDTFVTVCCVRFVAGRTKAIVANAGHVPPILRRATGQVSPFGRASGPPLGVASSQYYADEEIPLAPGDTVFLMTDGLVEALDRPGDRMGMRLLLGLVADAPRDLESANERILAAVERERLMRQVDDVTLVAIEVAGS
jgi:serine phosphatase RsbU (regulator of sigma subunit)